MSHHRHKGAAAVVGSEPPAVSISWGDGFFVVIYSDMEDATGDEDANLVCLGCLVESGDVQLGAGLDLARRVGQCDWDEDREEWFEVALAERPK